ncbi:hypothetical protein GCM10011575_25390 [Microlunatus endophyticus]|uniref:Aminoglycoside phosphotransferase domain-containing protein n=1 Tax=Microlunatus endophyticus TaxID=1716077 RepID=A0A917SBH4_9ACTN|nr:aminoglycoside phosphotransferase family protein [Microlunatus endophyticus]GGL65906.1 hypothetical protein GCM10011575_25390 [Microlunatus endophyticus]
MGLPERRQYSQRLGVIEATQLDTVAEQFGIGTIVDVWTPSGGLFGQILMLETTDGRYVFRGNPHGHTHLTKERRVARLIHERSQLPAAWPYRISDDATLFGWTYAIMPMLPGTCGRDLWASADPTERVGLAESAGRGLAMLHEVTAPMHAVYDPQVDDFVPVTTDFTTWWLERLDDTRTECRAADALSSEAERFIDGVVERDLPGLTVPFTPALVHHDFKPGNLNFTPTKDSFEPSGVFDLFEAYIADPEEDLVRMLWEVETDAQRRAFIDGYTDSGPLRDGAADRLELYALADWLVIWAYGRRNQLWFNDVTFEESFGPILARARQAVS